MTISRVTTYLSGQLIDPVVHNQEHDLFVSACNTNSADIDALESSNMSIAGNKTFTGTTTFSGNVTFSGTVTGVTSGLISQLGPAVSNRRYIWPYVGSVTATLITNANRLYFFPFIGPGGAYDNIICNLDSNNTGNAIMGIYSNSNGKPSTLLKSSSTFSLASGTGNKVVALTSSETLVADTLYWLAINTEGAGNYLYRAVNANVGPGMPQFLGVDSTYPTSEALNSYYAYYISHTYTGTLPASPTVNSSDATSIVNVPLIWLEAV